MEGHYEKSTNVEKQSKNECYEGIGVRNYGTLSYSFMVVLKPNSGFFSKIILSYFLRVQQNSVSSEVAK